MAEGLLFATRLKSTVWLAKPHWLKAEGMVSPTPWSSVDPRTEVLAANSSEKTVSAILRHEGETQRSLTPVLLGNLPLSYV